MPKPGLRDDAAPHHAPAPGDRRADLQSPHQDPQRPSRTLLRHRWVLSLSAPCSSVSVSGDARRPLHAFRRGLGGQDGLRRDLVRPRAPRDDRPRSPGHPGRVDGRRHRRHGPLPISHGAHAAVPLLRGRRGGADVPAHGHPRDGGAPRPLRQVPADRQPRPRRRGARGGQWHRGLGSERRQLHGRRQREHLHRGADRDARGRLQPRGDHLDARHRRHLRRPGRPGPAPEVQRGRARNVGRRFSLPNVAEGAGRLGRRGSPRRSS